MSPLPPPPVGGVPAPGPDPQRIIEQISTVTGAPPELIVAYIKAVPPDVLQQFLALGPAEMAQQLASFQSQAMPQGSPPQGPVDAPAPASPPPLPPPPMPPGPGLPPGMLPAGNTPPGMPPGMLPPDAPHPGMPSQAPLAPPPPPSLDDLIAQLSPPEEEQGKRRETPPPPLGRDLEELRKKSRFGKKPPTLDEVRNDADTGRQRYRPRNEHYRLGWKLYHLIPNKQRPDGTPIQPLAGEIYHTRSKPAVVFDRTLSIIEPFVDRLVVSTDAWSDEAETVTSAQNIENHGRAALERSYRKWDDHGSQGDPQPPFSRKLGGLTLGEGVCGRRVFIDPDDDGVIFLEPVPAAELYPLAHATTRQLHLPLTEARVHYPEIDEVWPVARQDERHSVLRPDENEMVRVIVWADRDGLWEAIAWDWVSWTPPGDTRGDGKDGGWIKAPIEIDFGFCPLRYPAAWFATPAGLTEDTRTDHQRYVNRTMFSPVLDSYELMNHLISIILTSANTVTNPAMIQEIDPEAEGPVDAEGKRLKVSRRIGAITQVVKGERVYTVPVDPAGTNALSQMMASLADEFGDTAPPVLSGRGEATSGADRFLAQQSAADYIITPAMKSIERWFSEGLREINELIVRKGKGKGKLFTGLPYRVRRTEDPQARRNIAALLEPADIERNGPDIEVRFKRNSLTEMQQRAAYWLQLLEKNVVDLNMVRDELDIEEPERVQQAVLRDKALQDERLLKTMITSALVKYNQKGGDLHALQAWLEERAKEQATANQPPPSPGIPSPPGAPPEPTPMPGQPMPGPPPPMRPN